MLPLKSLARKGLNMIQMLSGDQPLLSRVLYNKSSAVTLRIVRTLPFKTQQREGKMALSRLCCWWIESHTQARDISIVPTILILL